MTSNDPQSLLFIEPSQAPTSPIIDGYTRRVTAAWRARIDGPERYRGQHFCTGKGCKATSGNGDHSIGGCFETNSLAIHYIACHRAEVPAGELEKILKLPAPEVSTTGEPTEGELSGDWRACDPQ